jgi:DUF4097 and DUF4098 domain-containing protein YvlB
MTKLIYLLICVCFSASVWAQNAVKEQIVVPLSNPGKPGILEVGLTNGAIKVSGYDGKEVIVEASVPSRTNNDSDEGDKVNTNNRRNEKSGSSEGMKRISSNAFSLEVEENNNSVEIQTDSWKRRIDVTVRVPKNFSLKLSSVNYGMITVEEVNGDMEISSVNGGITLTNVSGSASVNTVNGHITASFKDITRDVPMAFTTLNGNVDVTFPSNVKVSPKIKTDSGEIFTDFDMAIDASKPKVNQKNTNGTYRVTIEDWVYGKINGGGPECMFKNMHGDIFIRKAK